MKSYDDMPDDDESPADRNGCGWFVVGAVFVFIGVTLGFYACFSAIFQPNH